MDIFPTAPEPTVVLAGDLGVDDQLELFTQHLDGVGTPYPMLGELVRHSRTTAGTAR